MTEQKKLSVRDIVKQKFFSFSKRIKGINSAIKDATKYMASAFHEWESSKQLQECDINSLLYSIQSAAELGLYVGKLHGQAWIVPYWNSKNRTLEAQFQIGYKGLIVLAKRSGYTIYSPQCICRGDKYKIDMANNKITHELDLDNERGEPLLWYVKVKDDTTGNIFFERMTIQEINKRRDQSLEKIKEEDKRKYSPWITWYEEMCAKTVIKKACKIIPLNDDVRWAISKDDIIEEKEINGDVIGDRIDIIMEPVEEETINPIVDEPVVLSSIDKVKAMQEKALNKNNNLTQEDLDKADKEPLEF
jgi:recombination protein RecT